MVFTGNANPKLAADVVKRLGMSLGSATVGRFSDGEVNVELLQNVRGKDVFVQPTCVPTNDNLMELVILVDALKRASPAGSPPRFPISAMPARIAGRARRGCRSRPGGRQHAAGGRCPAPG